MSVVKRVLALLVTAVMLFALAGCESDEAELKRLEREAQEARERANEAQSYVDALESLLGK